MTKIELKDFLKFSKEKLQCHIEKVEKVFNGKINGKVWKLQTLCMTIIHQIDNANIILDSIEENIDFK